MSKISKMQRKIQEYGKLSNKERKDIWTKYVKQEDEYWACDYECTVTEPYKVYLVTCENIETKESLVFYNIPDFLEYFGKKRNVYMWFHNGEKYDNYFTIAWLTKRTDRDYLYSLGSHLTIKCRQPYLDTDGRNGKIKNKDILEVYNRIHIYDSRKVLNSSLKAIGQTLGLTKGTDKKIETPLIAYKRSDKCWGIYNERTGTVKKRKDSFKEALKTEGWLDYAIQDAHILAEAIRQYKMVDYLKDNKSTAAGIAWSQLMTYEPYEEYIKSLKQTYNKEDYKFYKSELRRAVRAFKGGLSTGINFGKHNNVNKLIKTDNGYYLDYTSMYPSIYMNPEQYPLPQSVPCNHETNLYIIHFDRLVMDCKEDSFPLIKQRTDEKGVNASYYRTHFDGKVSLTSIEWQYVKEHYIIDFERSSEGEVVYYEEHKVLEQALVEHGSHWYQVKLESTGTDAVKRAESKLMLNSVYGYLAFFEKEIDLYKYDKEEDGTLVKLLSDKSVTGLKYAEVAAAAFITAYGRVKLATDINKIGLDYVAGCDTDSLICFDLTLDELKERVQFTDESETEQLGLLKCEATFSQAKYIRAKTYCLADSEGNVIKTALAGSPYRFKHIENFNVGQEYGSKEVVLGIGGCGIEYKLKTLGIEA